MREELKSIIEKIESIEKARDVRILEFDELIAKRYNEILEENGDAYIDEEYNSLTNQKQTEEEEFKTHLDELYSKKEALEKEIEADDAERKQLEEDKEKRLKKLADKINARIEALQDAGEDVYLDEELTSMQLEFDKIKEEKILTQREKAEIEKAKEAKEKAEIEKEKKATELAEAKKVYTELKREKNNIEQELIAMKKELEEDGTYKKLEEERNELKEELKKLKEGSIEYKECASDIEKISEELSRYEKEIKAKNEKLAKIVEEMTKLEEKYGKEQFIQKVTNVHRVENSAGNKQEAQSNSTVSNVAPIQIDPKKFTYRASTEGVYYNSELITSEELETKMNVLYKGEYDEKYSEIVNELLEKGNDEYLVGLILNDDKLDSKQMYERLLAYRDVLFESGKQDKENIQIEYDLRNTSIISRIMGKCKYSPNFVTDLKEIAYKNRNNPNAKIVAGPFTKLQFKIREAIEKVTTKRVEEPQGKEEKVTDTASQSENQTSKSWTLTPEAKKAANSKDPQSQRTASIAQSIKTAVLGNESSKASNTSNKDGIEL